MYSSIRFFLTSILILSTIKGGEVLAQSSFKTVDLGSLNLFIGSSNFGTTNPGAQVPHGMMNITPFNVMGKHELNKYDKDSRWWSTPYVNDNHFLTGFSQVNLSGVGCPDLGGLLLMPTSGELKFDPVDYGSVMRDEHASPGCYSVYLDKYKLSVILASTERSSIMKVFSSSPEPVNILLNLGDALSNERGATCHFVDEQTILGYRMMGNFCYNNDAVYPLYFAMKLDKKPDVYGVYKKQEKRSAEAAWDKWSGKYKPYPNYRLQMSGDMIGAYARYHDAGQVTVRFAVSTISAKQALKNLYEEQEHGTLSIDSIVHIAAAKWRKALSVVSVKGDEDKKRIFYSALYHCMIHPNMCEDADGSYRSMEHLALKQLSPNDKHRWTVYSLWDTFRTLHPLLCIIDPAEQADMVRTLLSMYQEWGHLPKWELYSRETFTMEGDPAAIMINDTWQRGIRDFDEDLALSAMLANAENKGKDSFRPNMYDYLNLGYVPIKQKNDNSVSQSLEYYLSDYNIAVFAKSQNQLGIYKTCLQRAMNFFNLFSKEDNMFRPKCENGHFYKPFSKTAGQHFTDNPGFHEGCAWNYAFYVPFAIPQLTKLMGGENAFVRMLDESFANGYYDMSNEPDIDNVYLYCYFPKKAYRTQILLPTLLDKYFKDAPDGLPGNDDAGTMSAWAVFSMMGFYPISPGQAIYALTTPSFDQITIKLNKDYYPHGSLTIHCRKDAPDAKYIKRILLDNKPYRKGFIISHKELFAAKEICFELTMFLPKN